jgi:HK97 family phage prohead protease
MPRTQTIDEFRNDAIEGGVDNIADDLSLRASLDTEIKISDDAESRSMTFIISTATVDRMGDTVSVEGWDLSQFRKNPVVLWAHDSSRLPVASASESLGGRIWTDESRLMAEAVFTPKGATNFNDTVFDLLKGGFLNATSVGFSPKKFAFVDDPERRFGIDFIEQELLEFSIVPVPANPDALVQARSAGIDISPIEHWAEDIVRGAGNVVVPAERHANMEKAAKRARLFAKSRRDRELMRLRGST